MSQVSLKGLCILLFIALYKSAFYPQKTLQNQPCYPSKSPSFLSSPSLMLAIFISLCLPYDLSLLWTTTARTKVLKKKTTLIGSWYDNYQGSGESPLLTRHHQHWTHHRQTACLGSLTPRSRTYTHAPSLPGKGDMPSVGSSEHTQPETGKSHHSHNSRARHWTISSYVFCYFVQIWVQALCIDLVEKAISSLALWFSFLISACSVQTDFRRVWPKSYHLEMLS